MALGGKQIDLFLGDKETFPSGEGDILSHSPIVGSGYMKGGG